MMAAGFGWLWVGSGIVSRRCWWRGRNCHARRGMCSTTGYRRSLSRPGSTASSRGSARHTTPRAGAGPRCRRGATSACCWSATSRASTATGCRRSEPVPDHSWLSRTRARLPLEAHDAVFTWVLGRLAERGLVKGERIGVDASTMEANAAMRAIVRRETGEGYREMLVRMAEASGIETPTAEDLVRLDRRRKGKTLSNTEWESPTDPEARIAKLKDGRTHLACKPEHAVDLDTGAVVAAEMHPADRGDTATLPGTLESAARNLTNVGAPPSSDDPAECVADKG